MTLKDKIESFFSSIPIKKKKKMSSPPRIITISENKREVIQIKKNTVIEGVSFNIYSDNTMSDKVHEGILKKVKEKMWMGDHTSLFETV